MHPGIVVVIALLGALFVALSLVSLEPSDR